MPQAFARLALKAAAAAEFADFEPDACLVNRYMPGARLSLHQDKNERDYEAPIVSVSLGMPATFLFGGHERTDPTATVPLHGDVVGVGRLVDSRLRYHGVMPLKDQPHALLGSQRDQSHFPQGRDDARNSTARDGGSSCNGITRVAEVAEVSQ